MTPALACPQSEFRPGAHDLFWKACSRKVASFDLGPMLWLTDPDWGTKTEDQHWMDKNTEPIAPFPRKDYFLPVLDAILTCRRLFIWKSREMMTSWLVCAYVAWMCQWFPQMMWVLQCDKEDKAIELVNYCRILYRQQPGWMSARNPVVADNTTEIKLRDGGHILGIPCGEHQIRLYHPFGYLMDEAATLPEAQQCFDTASPVAKQIIAVSTDNPGWFHNQAKEAFA